MGSTPDERRSSRTFGVVKRNNYAGVVGCWCLVITLMVLAGIMFDLLFMGSAPSKTEHLSDNEIESILESSSSEQQGTVLALQENFALAKQIRPPINTDPPEAVPGSAEMRDLYDIVTKWNPDNPEVPDDFVETLQHFDYGDEEERAIALKYRENEVPFKLYNVSDFNRVAQLWTDEYLLKALPTNTIRTHVERSDTNHFMFWTRKGLRAHTEFKEPTEVIRDMPFREWLAEAKKADAEKLSNASSHLYFMSSAEAFENGRTFISRDLKLFSTHKDNFFISNVRANKGIQCRFGMRGIIAEAHYDSGRNMVAMLKGSKRYILAPPWACDKLGIISDNKHPSYRHSVIDWSDPQQALSNGFKQADAIDTVVRMGEVLYIPSFWFHYIISLSYSIQCNSRSGFPKRKKGVKYINKCFKK